MVHRQGAAYVLLTVDALVEIHGRSKEGIPQRIGSRSPFVWILVKERLDESEIILFDISTENASAWIGRQPSLYGPVGIDRRLLQFSLEVLQDANGVDDR